MILEESDPFVLILIHFLLLALTVFAIFQDIRIRLAESRGAASLEAVRGDKSMSAIFTVYGAAMASFLVLTSEASGIEGNRVIFILLAFSCLTYLFFLSTWFRNRIFFPLMGREKRIESCPT